MKDYVLFAETVLVMIGFGLFVLAAGRPVKPTPKPSALETRIIEIQKNQIEQGRLLIELADEIKRMRDERKPLLPDVRLSK